MARITVEDCLTQENNRFALVLLSAKRTKQILQGSKLLISQNKNKAVVSSLREIADGQVRFMTPEEIAEAKAQEQLEAEERTREAFARLSQPVVETDGPGSNGSGSNGENGSNGTPKKVVDEDSDDGEI